MLYSFINYYGGKWRLAPKYPKPEHETIIEPFAGAAGYSVRHHQRKVVLYDLNPKIAGIWDYLINTPDGEIRKLPVKFDHVDEINVCQEAKWLIGFFLNHGGATPCLTPSKWSRQDKHDKKGFWGPRVRSRLATQVNEIRHWRIYNASYETIPNQPATWFVDPPYIKAGKKYPFSDIDYKALAAWCRERQGQTMVCEQEPANWLPFQPFSQLRAVTQKATNEVLWTNNK